MKRNPIPFLLLVFVCAGFFLRIYKIDEGLIFGYDQARDLYRAGSIIRNGDFKILGPETDIPGVHHGVGYYYLLSLPLALKADPVWAAGFFALIHALGIFFIYLIASGLFQKTKTAVITALLFAVSFEMVQYSRWLSNPSLGIFSIMLVFWGLWLWVKGRTSGLVWAFLGIGSAIHFQMFLVYLFALPFAVYYFYRPALKKGFWIGPAIISALTLAPFVLGELMFNFQSTKSLLAYFTAQSRDYVEVSGFLIRFLDRFAGLSFHTLLPVNAALALGLSIIIILTLKKQAKADRKPSVPGYILFWIIAATPIFIFSSGALNSEFGLIVMSVLLIFGGAYYLDYLSNTSKGRVWTGILLSVIAFTNIRFSLGRADLGAYIFSVQGPITYGQEKRIVDYTYNASDRQPFTVCTVTNPSFINTTWAYLYENYGLGKYGYLPFWGGPDQTGRLGSLPDDTTRPQTRYIIYEPERGMQMHVPPTVRRLEDYISDIVETRTFGEFKVEKRKLLTNEEMKIRRAGYNPDYNKANDERNLDLYRCYN